MYANLIVREEDTLAFLLFLTIDRMKYDTTTTLRLSKIIYGELYPAYLSDKPLDLENYLTEVSKFGQEGEAYLELMAHWQHLYLPALHDYKVYCDDDPMTKLHTLVDKYRESILDSTVGDDATWKPLLTRAAVEFNLDLILTIGEKEIPVNDLHGLLRVGHQQLSALDECLTKILKSGRDTHSLTASAETIHSMVCKAATRSDTFVPTTLFVVAYFTKYF